MPTNTNAESFHLPYESLSGDQQLALQNAVQHYEAALIRQEACQPQDQNLLAEVKSDLGRIRAVQSAYCWGQLLERLHSEAKALLTEALDHQQDFLDRGNLQLARTRLALAQLLADEVDFDGAKALCDLALSDLLSTRPDDHPDLVEVYLGTVAPSYTGPDARSHCKTLVEKALEISQEALPPRHPQIKFYEDRLDAALQKPSPTEQEF